MTKIGRGRGTRWIKPLITGAACALVYYVVLEAFLAIPHFNGATQIRPASGLSPTLGLIFGAPAVIGCAVANTISDAASESNLAILAAYTLFQLIYNGTPRLLWIATQRGRKPLPALSLGSSSRIAFFVGAALFDSVLFAAILSPLEQDVMHALDINIVHALNNFLALIYVGIPVLLVADAIRRRSEGRARNLAQRAALGALLAAGLASTACVAATFLPRVLRSTDAESFAALVASTYIAMSATTFSVFALACVMLRIIETKLAHPIDELTASSRAFARRFEEEGAEATAAGALDVKLDGERPLAEIAELIEASNTMRRALGQSVVESSRAQRDRDRMAAEMDVAAKIQSSMLPRSFDELRERYGIDVNARMMPARQVGGDFYDVFSIDNSRLCLLIADVSDKGIPAALFMMRSMTEIRDCVRLFTDISQAFDTANARLCDGNESSLFVTAFAAVMDMRTGRVQCCNAGHNPPRLFRGSNVLPIEVRPGLPLGVLEQARYTAFEMPLLPGDGMFLYTDGVTDAANSQGELYGTKRLDHTLQSICTDAAQRSDRAVQTVASDAIRFSHGVAQADDLTLLSITWLPQAWRIEIDPDQAQCEAAVEFFSKVLAECNVPRKTAFDIELIVEELFVNIASHAFEDGSPKQPVTLIAGYDPSCTVFHLVFCDKGTPYDPTRHDTAPLSPTADLEPGGLGLLLVKTKSDGMFYDRIDDMNVLHVVKDL